MFSVYPQGGRGGAGTPRYLTSTKVPTLSPNPGQDGVGEGVPQGTYPLPRYLPPPPIQVRMGERVPQGNNNPPRYLPLPLSRSGWGGGLGRGTSRYLPPCQGTYPPPHPGQDGGGVTPRYLPPAKVPTPSLIQVRMWGADKGGTPRYLPPPSSQGTYPHPGIGEHMEYLIRCGQYASCVHAGGLSCAQNCQLCLIYKEIY